MKRTHQEKIRLGLILVMVCLFFGVVAVRLVHLQVVLGNDYSEIVARQSSGTLPIPASRGILYERNGRVVANNVVLKSLFAYPASKEQLWQVAAYIEKVFNLPRGSAVKKYNLDVKRFRWIKRLMSDELAAKIEDENPSGLYLRDEIKREYPFGLTGKQILGFTDIDSKGCSGLELMYNSLLAGKEGKAHIYRDGLSNTYRIKETALTKPEPGKSMVLTIDWDLQEIVEEELQQGVAEYHAQSGMAVFINNNNGDILAMAHYDPDEKYPERPVKLRPVCDQFEPGSIFKVFPAAAMIDKGMINYDDTIYCEEGKWKIGRRTLHDDKKHAWLNFRSIIELSSNIGIAKMAIEMGSDELLNCLDRFSIGKKLELGWPGETGGTISQPNRWSDFTIASLTMGHAVAVNALQMAVAFGAIANGGKLYQPRIVLGQVDHQGNIIERYNSKILNTVMKESSADTLKSILRGVVLRGTAEAVNSSIISIAGKTGTAQIPDLENRRYFYNKYMASFAGFFPVEKPVVTGIVILKDPQPIHYGGWTSGPIFRRIAERYSIMNPDVFTEPERLLAEKSNKFENTVVVPDLVGREVTQANAIALAHSMEIESNDEKGIVVWQFPPPDRLAFSNDKILVVVENESDPVDKMADLTGFSIKEVSAFFHIKGLDFVVKGNGKVVKQSIKPGEPITRETVCQLECRPI